MDRFAKKLSLQRFYYCPTHGSQSMLMYKPTITVVNWVAQKVKKTFGSSVRMKQPVAVLFLASWNKPSRLLAICVTQRTDRKRCMLSATLCTLREKCSLEDSSYVIISWLASMHFYSFGWNHHCIGGVAYHFAAKCKIIITKFSVWANFRTFTKLFHENVPLYSSYIH